MVRVRGERHEPYSTAYGSTAIDFISVGDNGPLRTQETADDGSESSSIPPSGAEIWEEWHDIQRPEYEQLQHEIARALASSALILSQMDELLAN